MNSPMPNNKYEIDTMHLVVHPVPRVDSAVWPVVLTLALDDVVEEVAYVVTVVLPVEGSLTLLVAMLVSAIIFSVVWPLFESLAVLPVVEPPPLVAGAVIMDILALALDLVEPELPFIVVPILIDHPSL